MSTKQMFEEFLRSSGADRPVAMGPASDPGPDRALLEKRRDALISRAEVGARFSRYLVALIFIAYLVLLVVGVILGVRYAHNPKVLAAILGGDFLSLIGVVAGLRSTWQDATKLDMLLCFLPEIDALEAVKVIQALYYSGAPSSAGRGG